MKFICIAAMAMVLYSCNAKTVAHASANQKQYMDTKGNPVLLGTHTKEDLQQAPYNSWFDTNYAAYQVDSATAGKLKTFLKDKQFEIFMGTWCGDSQREVPRMFKILEYVGVQASQIKLVMVDNRISTYKQSPAHEEKDKAIHHVPDLIVYDNGKEINRIIESPVVSLEQDLFSIVNGDLYQPKYKAAALVVQLCKEKSAATVLKDSTNVLEKLKGLTASSSELNSLGYVWMAAGENDKAMLAFQLNAGLYPNEANVYDGLGKIYTRIDDRETAKKYYAKSEELKAANEKNKKTVE